MSWVTWNSVGALLGLALAGCGAPSPSILLVTLDTVRRDHVGAYGAESGLTPSLDALAAEGLVHDAAYTTMPTTAPAHLSLFTGLYPSEHGVRRNGDPLASPVASRFASRFASQELALRLRTRGYTTAAFVTSRLMSSRATGLRGFEIYDAPTGVLRTGEAAARAALAWLRSERGRPVFLFVHLYDAHAPYGSADEKRRSFPVEASAYGWIDDGVRYATESERGAMAARYARGVRSADAALGRLIAGAREILKAPPLVIALSDHGETLAERLADRGYAYDHGEFLDLETVAIPLILAGPGVEAGRSRGAASIRDLYTTLLAAAGIEDPEAQASDRRDLRRRSAVRRLVGIERRSFGLRIREPVRAHGAAASDGTRLLILADDGSLTSGTGESGSGDTEGAAADLMATARDRLHRTGRASAPLDPETREALHELGYAE